MEEAAEYLNENPVEHADLLEALLNHGFAVDYFSADGIVISGGRVAMAALFPGGRPSIVADRIPRRHVHVIHSAPLLEEFSDRFPEKEPQVTHQMVYTESSIAITVPPSCSFRKLTEDDYDFVHSRYSLADGRYIASRLRDGALTGLEADGSLAGFIGLHAEGSMGMLEVDEHKRRRGYGELLERHLISQIVSRGGMPFCHIIDGNDKSMLLQRKLGLFEAVNLVYWL